MAELEQRVEGLLYRDVARIAGDTLEDGWDLVLFMPDLADALDDNGIPTRRRSPSAPGSSPSGSPASGRAHGCPRPPTVRAAERPSTRTPAPPGEPSCAGVTEAEGRPERPTEGHLFSEEKYAPRPRCSRHKEIAPQAW